MKAEQDGDGNMYELVKVGEQDRRPVSHSRRRERVVMRALSILMTIVSAATLLVGSILSSIEAEGHKQLLQSSEIQRTSTEIMLQFRWMVQSWKNVLLRGHDPSDLDQYWKELLDHQALALKAAQALKEHSSGEQERLIDEFIANQANLRAAYSKAIDIARMRQSFDYRAADRSVRGMDRSVLIPLERLVDAAEAMEKIGYEKHFSRIQNIQWATLSFFLTLLLSLWLIFSLLVKAGAAQEEALETQNFKLQILGRMSATIIHEIKNPMTVIYGRSQIIGDLLEKKDPTAPVLIKEHLKSIFKMVDRIARLIQSISRHSHPLDGLPKSPFSYASLLEEVELVVRSRFNEYGIAFSVTQPPVDCQILGREIEISQVLVNLLLNAADAVQKLRERWIKLEIIETNGFIEFHVHDSGPGIPTKTLEKLSRNTFTTKDVGKGTGQGLAITRKIIAEHSGYLAYDDSLPHTCFIVGLPKDEGLTRPSGKNSI